MSAFLATLSGSRQSAPGPMSVLPLKAKQIQLTPKRETIPGLALPFILQCTSLCRFRPPQPNPRYSSRILRSGALRHYDRRPLHPCHAAVTRCSFYDVSPNGRYRVSPQGPLGGATQWDGTTGGRLAVTSPVRSCKATSLSGPAAGSPCRWGVCGRSHRRPGLSPANTSFCKTETRRSNCQEFLAASNTCIGRKPMVADLSSGENQKSRTCAIVIKIHCV
ncbi:hypothetical protein LPU83_pLPU83d_1217 (plasmid) [Rhizobium favelukesii]|uniref:Uncharacterized protein n=1 Tax=Rhizobium favelukesii TaxID=348824 RepID=W6RNC5_9HYPH|nr:hypothetical protein LPU83_pLPU83d_1217 [Rhizobium favelukesii]